MPVWLDENNSPEVIQSKPSIVFGFLRVKYACSIKCYLYQMSGHQVYL